MTEWFVNRDTYTVDIEHPDTKEKATVTMRPLNAGDRAEFNEIRILQSDDDDGASEGSIRPGRMQLLTVERAVTEWTLPQPPSSATIANLDPRVFDQIYEAVSFGNRKKPDAIEGVATRKEDDTTVVPLQSDTAEKKEPVADAAVS